MLKTLKLELYRSFRHTYHYNLTHYCRNQLIYLRNNTTNVHVRNMSFTQSIQLLETEDGQSQTVECRPQNNQPIRTPPQPVLRYFSIKIQDYPALLSHISQLLWKYQHKHFLKKLIDEDQISKNLHITLAHISCSKKKPKNTESGKNCWQEWYSRYESLKTEENPFPQKLGIKVNLKLEKLLFNHKAMAILVSDIEFHNEDTNEPIPENMNFEKTLPHITMGALQTEKPGESLNKQTHDLLHGYELFQKRFPNAMKHGGHGFRNLVVIKWKKSVILRDLPVIANYSNLELG